MEHHHQAAAAAATVRLSYDRQGPAAMLAGEHGALKHNEHMINYDQTQEQQGPLMAMMKMYFHFGLGDMVLFRGLVVDSVWKMWLTSLALFLAAILLEAIDYARGYLSCRCVWSSCARRERPAATSQTQLTSSSSSANIRNEPNGTQQQRPPWPCCSNSLGPTSDSMLGANGGQVEGLAIGRKRQEARYFPIETRHSAKIRALQAGLQFIRTGLSLCLMLVAMTYNVCLIFPVVLGSGVGFFIFYRAALDSKSAMCH